ncbi:MAG: hypothetical protein JWN74_1673 [Acidobacteriaceae bacterium]|nr:hypothetical protein [Acidobacteriaceae bacterium]
MGYFDGTNVQRAKSDTSGNADVVFPSAQHVIVDTAPTTAVTASSLPLPSNAAQETGGNLATLAGAVSGAKVAVKSADGDQATIGAKADAKSAATDTTAITLMQVMKELSFLLQNTLTVTGAGGTFPVTGTVTANAGSNLNTSLLALDL